MSLKLAKARRARNSSREVNARHDLFGPPASAQASSQRSHTDDSILIPRALPLFMRLIRELCPKGAGNPVSVYLDFWARVHEGDWIEITHDERFAYVAGYSGSRGLRTWRDHVRMLAELGFIAVQKRSNGSVAAVRVVDPYPVAARFRAAGRVSEEWWGFFTAHCRRMGVSVPLCGRETLSG